MTTREAAIVSAYTGILLGNFKDMHKYVEELIGRPVWTHEFADKEFVSEIKAKAKSDFVNITIEEVTYGRNDTK